jgi:toxin ParE1/3/4
MRFRVHPEARLELMEAAQYYEQERPGYGARFRQEYERKLEQALRLPGSGAPILVDGGQEVRRFGFSIFPYSLVVTVLDDVLTVLAVAHGHRRPGYWRDRLKP